MQEQHHDDSGQEDAFDQRLTNAPQLLCGNVGLRVFFDELELRIARLDGREPLARELCRFDLIRAKSRIQRNINPGLAIVMGDASHFDVAIVRVRYIADPQVLVGGVGHHERNAEQIARVVDVGMNRHGGFLRRLRHQSAGNVQVVICYGTEDIGERRVRSQQTLWAGFNVEFTACGSVDVHRLHVRNGCDLRLDLIVYQIRDLGLR